MGLFVNGILYSMIKVPEFNDREIKLKSAELSPIPHRTSLPRGPAGSPRSVDSKPVNIHPDADPHKKLVARTVSIVPDHGSQFTVPESPPISLINVLNPFPF
jgi:hypothetical protein